VLCGFALTACKTPAPVPSAPATLPPSLRVLESAALTLPANCHASGSYVVEFKVLENGRTGSIQPANAPACVNQALTAWIASFRYAPQPEPVASSVEWMLVQRKKLMVNRDLKER
jgi:hypothetical protein